MLNSKIKKIKKNKKEYGLFAIEVIEKNEIIWMEDENNIELVRFLSIEEIENLPIQQKNVFLTYCFQIDINLYSGYINLHDVETDDANYMNHSCDPNCWYEGEILIARRKIEIGEEICYDYGTDTTGRDWNFECTCGAINCRKFIKRDDWKKIKNIYDNHFITYIVKKLLIN